MTSTLALVTNLHCGQASAHFFLSKNDDIEALCPTDDVFKSTVHRAINKSGKERFSIPLFFGTDYHVNIEVCGFSSESKKRKVVNMYVFAAYTKLRVCRQAGKI